MNSLLMKYRPKDMEKGKWEELWKNSHPQLQPLADVLKEMMSKEAPVRADDFDCANHYGKLVADQVRKQTIQDILNLLPDTVVK